MILLKLYTGGAGREGATGSRTGLSIRAGCCLASCGALSDLYAGGGVLGLGFTSVSCEGLNVFGAGCLTGSCTASDL